MPGLGKPIMPEDMIIRGLILNSKDLFSKEAYEERVDKELAELMHKYPPRSLVDREGVREIRDVVREFIEGKRDITGNKVEKSIAEILQELDQIKLKAAQEEIIKINGLRKLFEEESKIEARSLRKELEGFAASIKGSTIASLRRNLRGEKRLRRGKAPLGYVLKKLRQDRYLDAEVTKRAYRIGEHTAEEHALYYRAIDLINALKQNPSEEKLKQLKQWTETLIRSYENDLDDFLNIESGIRIQEARKLHRIDHYILFLESRRYSSNANSGKNINPLINQLNALKKLANDWVYQDTINAKKLQQYAVRSLEYGEQLLKNSERSGEFPGIVVEKIRVYNVPALKIFNPERLQEGKVNRGIVLVHGAFGTKESLLTLGKRLATQDFLVVSIDLPQHGENRALFKYGIACEFIHEAVVYLRSQGMRNVGVVGHSFGAMSTLFAICGYNLKVENEFFDINSRIIKQTSRLIKQIENVVRALEKITEKSKESKQSDERAYKEQYFRAVYYSTLLSQEFNYLKQKLLKGLEYMFRGSGVSGKIDAAVLLSPPLTVQLFFAPQQAYIFQHLPKLLSRPGARWVTGQITNGFFKTFEKQEGKDVILPKYINEKDKAQLVGAVIPDLYETFHYVEHMKNPYDFMEAIDYFCDKIRNPDMSTEFFRYYREFIRRTPKLYIYGLEDMDLLKPLWSRLFSFTKTHQAELEDHYKSFGETEIVRIPNVNHSLVKEGKEKQFEGARLPRITYKIVTFFNNYLARGRLV